MIDVDVQQQSFDEAVEYVRAMLDAEAGPDDERPALEGIAGEFGRFEGLPAKVVFDEVDPDEDHRPGKLIDPISYHGPNGTAWPVPGGAWLDGASIPRALWSLIGSPYTGPYLEPSIVHDHYCIEKDRTWRDTHRMFHDAMRCRGMGKARAGVMFYAVYRFGPRWPDPGIEGLVSDAASQPLDQRAGEELARDAEAIVKHDLNVDEVAALAETRMASSAEAGALEGVSLDRARLLVVPGGRGNADDAAAVAQGAMQLPEWVVDHFMALGIRIVACRGSVTDFETALRGVTPRGWERIGRTWDSVPGTYFQHKKRVVVATIGQGGRRVVPGKNTGLHGSDDLLVHESLHGYDYSTAHAVLSASSFRDARDADVARLTTYEVQAGQAGLEETFAETGAQFCIDPPRLAGRCPTLAAFWRTMPIDEEGIAAAPTPAEPQPIGTVTRGEAGELIFELRALGEGGAIGHATIIIAPGDPQYEELETELFGGEEGLEGVAAGTALFYG